MREFRAHHEAFAEIGATVAGISLDPIERAMAWAERLALPYPILSDADRRAGEAFGLIRRLGIGGWTIELLKRATIVADRDGFIRAVWEEVKIKTHAKEVLEAVRHLRTLESPQPPATPASS